MTSRNTSKDVQNCKNPRNGGVMEGCTASVVGDILESQLFVFLHCPTIGLEGSCYKNQSTLFYLVPGGKEKKLTLASTGLSQDTASKATTFLETT